MLRRFCMNQNIRSLLSCSERVLEVTRILLPLFERSFDARTQGTLEVDKSFNENNPAVAVSGSLGKFKEIINQLDRLKKEPSKNKSNFGKLTDEYEGLLHWWIKENTKTSSYRPTVVRLRESITLHGIEYASHSFWAKQDTQVIVREKKTGDWFPGVALMIFSLPSLPEGISEDFFFVKRFLDLPPEFVPKDSYRQFPIAGGRVYQDKFGTTEVVPAASIVSHFAGMINVLPTIPINHVHVLPLDKF